MALGFTAMLRNFAEGANDSIAAKLEEFFLRLSEIRDRDDYESVIVPFVSGSRKTFGPPKRR